MGDTPYNLDSELLYIVVITAADAGFKNPHIAFKYGGDVIDSDKGDCYCVGCDSGLAACTRCECAFNC